MPDAPKKHRAGTHRIVSPEETLESVRRFFPVMGITRVADITGLDVIGLPVVTVCRPNSRAVTVSLGKGLELAAAKASGVMESIEAFMAERITLPLVLGSVSDLRSSHPLVDVDLLPRTTDSAVSPGCAHLVDRGAGAVHRNPEMGSLRDGPHRVHAAQADRNGMFHRHLQRAGFRQSPARGDQPRDLRDRGT